MFLCFLCCFVSHPSILFFFFFNDTATTEIYTLSLHDALPILNMRLTLFAMGSQAREGAGGICGGEDVADRKSTRLNSSHLVISYAVFCLKKKKKRHATRFDDSPCMCTHKQ